MNGNAELKQWNRKTPLLAGPPVVADLDNDGWMEMVVSTSDQEITCLEAPRKNENIPPKIRWRMKGQGMSKDAANKQDGVLAADLDNDQQKEIVFAQATLDGKASILAVRPDGSIKWQHVFQGFNGTPPF